ncbi:hypothetical protein CTI12_AA478120 [Artemisia annua]|uniref:Uncharacterized protein n=1 Tax=Artemisia annua TaxID=35608 RepID=A0A2U1LKM8_ARTAN|nr:hypothetical protein CTI12_AA478120 [Artemisia annua]
MGLPMDNIVSGSCTLWPMDSFLSLICHLTDMRPMRVGARGCEHHGAGPMGFSRRSILEQRKLPTQRATYEYLKGKMLDVLPEYSKKAEDHLSKAVKLNPSLADAWLCLGNCIWKKGDLPATRNCFNLALSKEEIVAESIKHTKEAIALDVKDGNSLLNRSYKRATVGNLLDGLNKTIAIVGKVLFFMKHDNVTPLHFFIQIKEGDQITLLDPNFRNYDFSWKEKHCNNNKKEQIPYSTYTQYKTWTQYKT